MSSTGERGQSPSPRKYPNVVTYISIPGTVDGKPPPHKAPEPRYGEVIYVTKGEFLTWGGTAILERLPSGDVMKTPIPNPYCPPEEKSHRQYMRLEAQIYARIGSHQRIPKIIDWDLDSCCLTMEYLENGNIREYIRENHQNLTPQLRLRWSRQAAEALSVLHRFEVIHCDLSPRNFLLDSNLHVKLADFGGASLCGSEPSATPATRFRHPGYDYNAPAVFADDLFSFGSLIFFIMTGSYPYEEVASDEVEKLYEVQEFPDVSSVSCGTIIMQCWRRQVSSAQDVYDHLMGSIEIGHSLLL
ncbi:hypothetical protein N7456_009179 [Penicillium angulare]|uniref:EKC/KEOPS complex subunit BUD32 n=1 Tax=Penicillium angulare TaxID=116970 RepID=A0A9W9F444_9EURO|nr:hypothetical protein N7456_009179 [Penicillium angulare]